MKAAILDHYDRQGTTLRVCDIPDPAVGPDDVLVRVTFAGVNPLDNMIARGEVKLIVPYPMPLTMGNEFVGMVERTGTQVTRFSIGERVYGRMPLDSIGAFAQFVSIPQSALAATPEYMSDEEAACVPLTALTAWQAYELMHVAEGGRLFISGATGSLGAMAVPIARDLGLEVSVSGGASGRRRMLDMGVTTFVDYKTQDYATMLSGMDYVLDTVGDREIGKEMGILKRGGILVSLRGTPNGAFARRIGLPWYKRLLFDAAGMRNDCLAHRRGQRYAFIFVHADGAGLDRVSRMFEHHEVHPTVNDVYDLAQVNDAMERVRRGGSNGKTLLRIG